MALRYRAQVSRLIRVWGVGVIKLWGLGSVQNSRFKGKGRVGGGIGGHRWVVSTNYNLCP